VGFPTNGIVCFNFAIKTGSHFSSLKPCGIMMYYVYVLKSKKDGKFSERKTVSGIG